MPPFGTNPPRQAVNPASTNFTTASELTTRSITNDPRELWYLALPSKLTPKQVLQILRSALGGDIWQQWQLISLMLDSWPMLRKCSHELRSAVARAKFEVHPYCEPGKEPTESAKERADFVNRCIRGMKPDPMTDERGWQGMIYDFTDAVLNGMEATEMLWTENANGEIVPRAATWIHPRHFTFTNDGKIAMFDGMYQRLYFGASRVGRMPDQNKFIVCQYTSRSGSSLGAGLARPLAYDWSAVMFNRDWMLTTAQNYGSPMLNAEVAPGTPQAELDKIDQMLSQAGNQRWIRHVTGSTVEVIQPVSMGPDNPQRHLMELADEHCQLLLLGQTVTTHGKSGGLNGNDDAQSKVRREYVDALANWVASDCLSQLVRMILRVNYGNENECPTILPDFTEVPDPKMLAEVDDIFLKNKVPMNAEEFYKRHNRQMPETGDRVIVGGQLGKMGAIDTAIEGVPPAPEKLGPDGKPLEPKGNDEEKPVEASNRLMRGSSIRGLLGQVSDPELQQLNFLVVKAKQARHLNGEAAAVETYLAELENKYRI
jgi:phage gp29-like protein